MRNAPFDQHAFCLFGGVTYRLGEFVRVIPGHGQLPPIRLLRGDQVQKVFGLILTASGWVAELQAAPVVLALFSSLYSVACLHSPRKS